MNIPIKEGREILARVMSALVDAPECYIPVRGPWLPLTEAQTANWEARQTVSKLLRGGDANLETSPFTILENNTPSNAWDLSEIDTILLDNSSAVL
ncbi:MAG: hypothetical protein WCC95_18275 [Candidatus Sulfotelmatobacter sp.]